MRSLRLAVVVALLAVLVAALAPSAQASSARAEPVVVTGRVTCPAPQRLAVIVWSATSSLPDAANYYANVFVGPADTQYLDQVSFYATQQTFGPGTSVIGSSTFQKPPSNGLIRITVTYGDMGVTSYAYGQLDVTYACQVRADITITSMCDGGIRARIATDPGNVITDLPFILSPTGATHIDSDYFYPKPGEVYDHVFPANLHATHLSIRINQSEVAAADWRADGCQGPPPATHTASGSTVAAHPAGPLTAASSEPDPSASQDAPPASAAFTPTDQTPDQVDARAPTATYFPIGTLTAGLAASVGILTLLALYLWLRPRSAQPTSIDNG